MPKTDDKPNGRLCSQCGAQWVMSRDVHRVTCYQCRAILPPFCPNNDYHEVRPVKAVPGTPLLFECKNGCVIGSFSRKQSESMRNGRKNLSRFLTGGPV